MFRSESRATRISHKLLLSGAALPMLLASAVAAQAQTAPAETAETVVVTGSLIARPDYNTATPTVTASTQDLQQSGQIALEQGLTELPQFTPDVTGAGPFIGGSGEVNLDLRYLGPQRNLILLDGRRLLPSAADGTVDLNQLPQGIIGNVEIITGGASAVYGSDAVSGVVNFKTKKPFNGLDVTTSYGTTQTYGGSQFDVNGVGGFETDDGKGSLIFALEYTQRDKVNSASIPYLVQYGNYPGASWPAANSRLVPIPSASQRLIPISASLARPAGNVSKSELLGFNNNGSLYQRRQERGRAFQRLQSDSPDRSRRPASGRRPRRFGPPQKLCELVPIPPDPLERLHQGRLGHRLGRSRLYPGALHRLYQQD